MSYVIATAYAVRGCLTGEYPADDAGQLQEADAIIAQSFGTREAGTETPHGRVNALLAARAVELSEQYSVPIIAQSEIADALKELGIEGVIRIDGDPSSPIGGGLDSWGVLQRAKKISDVEIKNPMIAAHAHHIARIALQAAHMGMDPRLPGDMPQEFAPNSEQWWTRSHGLWVLREVAGMAALKAQGKL